MNHNNFWLSAVDNQKVEHTAYNNSAIIIDQFVQDVSGYIFWWVSRDTFVDYQGLFIVKFIIVMELFNKYYSQIWKSIIRPPREHYSRADLGTTLVLRRLIKFLAEWTKL